MNMFWVELNYMILKVQFTRIYVYILFVALYKWHNALVFRFMEGPSGEKGLSGITK